MIQVGDKLPGVTLHERGEQGLDGYTVAELTAGKTVVFFAVPGAFTPTCSEKHVPGFIAQAAALRAAGVAQVYCVAVNDPFIMRLWAASFGDAAQSIRFLSDGNAAFTEALGMGRDMSNAAMGLRSKRYALIAEDGVVRWLGVDESGLQNASAESVLAALRG
ncbi:peroxiredoxin [Halothiobacillus sp. DCM-1]|uniref:peroxiredoxin n=1 Tax=Halothiobacillus sp. DCM-1 TaxID=3112558 RepID=UPI00324A9EA6